MGRRTWSAGEGVSVGLGQWNWRCPGGRHSSHLTDSWVRKTCAQERGREVSEWIRHPREGLWNEGSPGAGRLVSPSLWILNRVPLKPEGHSALNLEGRELWRCLASSCVETIHLIRACLSWALRDWPVCTGLRGTALGTVSSSQGLPRLHPVGFALNSSLTAVLCWGAGAQPVHLTSWLL